ncbi:Metacaspase-4 [Platanthera zijinensis]|uniref:Metacaspase-4 n=1 Tax=Platanthera zijinensis TaxID=2320716 RepID=A0AAP0FWD6_9ASPA
MKSNRKQNPLKQHFLICSRKGNRERREDKGKEELMAKKKAAVLIGCNYPGSKMELKGCVNDVHRMRRSLVDFLGFNDSDITVLIDTDDSHIQPTGVNIRRAINRLVRSANPGDELFVHYSGHGARLPVEPEEDDSTGYHECIVPTDMNLILDEDFRDFADKLPAGCRITFVADSCNSGGLLENAKEQIGESTNKNITHSEFVDVPDNVQLHRRAGEEGDIQFTGRALPVASILEHLKQRAGTEQIYQRSIRSILIEVFGEAVSPRMLTKSFKQHWREISIGGGRKEEKVIRETGEAKQNKKGSLSGDFSGPTRRKAILISACQSDQNAADAKPVLRPEGAFGALSNAVQSILVERQRSSGDGKIAVSNREMVMMAREILAKQGFTQRPGLYCSDEVADEPFIVFS